MMPDEAGEIAFDHTLDWFYEGNIQAKIRDHLSQTGWEIKGEADTQKRSKVPDLLAEKDNILLHVEVKGYPSEYYINGKNKGQKKKTRPTVFFLNQIDWQLYHLKTQKASQWDAFVTGGL